MPDLEAQVDYIEDDVLRLIFLSCHPSLSADSRAALTLRLVGGLTTAEIARGFLSTEAAMGQRISRAKRTLSEARAEFELPTGAERTQRLDDVMAVIYLIFNEGYTATAGDSWMRPDLANEAMRLARMLAAHGKPVGKYFLQASIAAQHARAVRAEDTDWRQIAMLYDVLAEAAPGPIVEVNRAVAHGRAFGPDAGLRVLDGLDANALGDSPLAPSVRGDLLERAGRHSEAAAAFTEAVGRTRNEGERTVLRRRSAENLARASKTD